MTLAHNLARAVRCIGWFGGMVLMGDLSVLGIGLSDAPTTELLSQFRRWKWLGFVVMLVSGGLLWWCQPVVCYKSVSFRIKLGLLALLGINALLFRKAKPATRLGACLSLLLWEGERELSLREALDKTAAARPTARRPAGPTARPFSGSAKA